MRVAIVDQVCHMNTPIDSRVVIQQELAFVLYKQAISRYRADKRHSPIPFQHELESPDECGTADSNPRAALRLRQPPSTNFGISANALPAA